MTDERDRLTGINSGPGTPRLILGGRHSRAHMLHAYRHRYRTQLDEAQRALAVTDTELTVETWRGMPITTNREPITDQPCTQPDCHTQPTLLEP